MDYRYNINWNLHCRGAGATRVFDLGQVLLRIPIGPENVDNACCPSLTKSLQEYGGRQAHQGSCPPNPTVRAMQLRLATSATNETETGRLPRTFLKAIPRRATPHSPMNIIRKRRSQCRLFRSPSIRSTMRVPRWRLLKMPIHIFRLKSSRVQNRFPKRPFRS